MDFLHSWALFCPNFKENDGVYNSKDTCACSDTNLVLSEHIEREKAPFPVDVHCSNISFA